MLVWTKRLPRISCNVPVGLHAPPKCHVEAMMANLSESGMFVVTEQLLPPDSRVSCELTIEGSRRLLVGRVVWARPPSSEAFAEPPGMGIEFTDQRDGDAEFLRTCVATRLGVQHPVDVWLPGMLEPASAGALLTADGVVLRTPLPAFQLGSHVLFRFAHGREELTGRIQRVRVTAEHDHAVPVLQIELALDDAIDSDDEPDDDSGDRGPL